MSGDNFPYETSIRLGKGQYGTVYLATKKHPISNTRYAIKSISKTLIFQQDSEAMVRAEIDNLKKLSQQTDPDKRYVINFEEEINDPSKEQHHI